MMMIYNDDDDDDIDSTIRYDDLKTAVAGLEMYKNSWVALLLQSECTPR